MSTDDEKFLRLSVSRVDTFKTCKAKYYYNYILELPTTDTYYTTIGKFIHKVLELFINKYKATGDLRTAASSAFKEAQKDEEIKPSLTRDIIKESMKWIVFLTKKFEEDSSQIPNTLDTELPFTFKLEEEKLLVRGVIDRVDRLSPNELLIIDYKTSQSSSYLRPFQLATYVHALKERFPNHTIKTAFELIRHDFGRLHFDLSDEDVEQALNTFREVGSEIRELSKLPKDQPWTATPSKLCSYCPFRQRCEKDRIQESPWQV
jgi:ATP-dependent helicase/DNAse subunit B